MVLKNHYNHLALHQKSFNFRNRYASKGCCFALEELVLLHLCFSGGKEKHYRLCERHQGSGTENAQRQ
jgi:hypothetical protein